ncbi:MAG: hypothetical protein Q9160_007771 [Pyrenula sp. 1 TL-2023]
MADSAIPLYTYTPLNNNVHTRIIELEPSDVPDGALRCRIVQFSLDDDPLRLTNDIDLSYEAISYAWGSSELSQNLIVNDSLLRVTASLADALRQFRRKSGVRRLWADAVCIHQRDEVEKTKQILLMPRIYREAYRVLVWLGSQRDRRSVHSSIRLLNGSLRSLDFFRQRPNSTDFKPNLSTEHKNFAYTIRRCLEDLLQFPWFSRRWIIQEVVLNPKVDLFCDDKKISVTTLRIVTRDIEAINHHLSLRSSKELNSLALMTELWEYIIFHRQGLKIERLLLDFDHFDCADDKDKIFALLGLAAGDIHLKTDYTNTTEEIYNDFAGALLRYRSNREVLEWLLYQAEARETGSTRSDGLASWSPDWRISPTFVPVIQRRQITQEKAMTVKFNVRPAAIEYPHGVLSWDPCFQFLKSLPSHAKAKVDSTIEPLSATEKNIPQRLKEQFGQIGSTQASSSTRMN